MTILFWRRTDLVGLERLALTETSSAVRAASTLVSTEHGGFRLDQAWVLSPDWRALSLHLVRHGPDGVRELRLERAGEGWLVDGELRLDLEGAEEPDLSATPFCNTFPIRRLGRGRGETLTLDTAFVDAGSMTVSRSSQRYERQGQGRMRYVDLGLSAGFEADIAVDDKGLVLSYEHLFERVAPA